VRISTTTLESFRLWSQPDQDWMTEESLIDTIRGRFVPTPAVRLGKAFGAVLETPERYEVPLGYVFDDAGFLEYQFSHATMAPALALMDRRGVYEAKATKEYGPHTVVAKADQLVGGRLVEHKTTTGTFDFEKYAASCQWRFMVDIFQPLSVTYHVFLLDDHENGVVELRGIESFNLYPYPALHMDCCELVEAFADYATARGLDGFLNERQRAAEAA
jgi:hypothetical protein